MGAFLSTQEQNLSTQLNKMVQKKVEELVQQVKKQLPQKMRQIDHEIYGSFRVIVDNVVEQTFTEFYGDSYDPVSLKDSIIYPPVNGFKPELGFNKKLLKFYPYTKKEDVFAKDFERNQMRRSLSEDPDLFTGDFGELYQQGYFEDSSWDDAWDEYNSILEGYEDFKPNNVRLNALGSALSVDDVYERARVRALQEFEKEYNLHIKPQILKKYGVKMG